jgi:hypothetical protein
MAGSWTESVRYVRYGRSDEGWARLAAVELLLSEISEDAVTETSGLSISALVQYLDANDAGPGFYTLARSKGLPVPATSADRHLFWAGHVGRVHQHYARR